jgi:hypothetical protein
MKVFLTILFIYCSVNLFSQSKGYVLQMEDGSLKIPDNSITINKISTLNQVLGTKLTIPTAGQGMGAIVTQNANKSTAVTLNKQYGTITMNGAALAAAAEVSFVVNNNTVASTDVVIVNIQSVGTAGAYLISVGAVGNGSFSITLSNASGGSLSQAVVLNFIVLKGVAN